MLPSHRFYRRNRGNRSVKPLTAGDEPDGAGTARGTPAYFATSNIEGRFLPALRLPAMPRRLPHTTIGTFAYCTHTYGER